MIEHKKHTPLVNEVFPTVNSIFHVMNYSFGMDNDDMDILFFTDYGYRTIAPLPQRLLGEQERLSAENIEVLARMLLAKYKNKWDRSKAMVDADYDPLHNYLDEYKEHRDEVRDEDDLRTRNLTTVDSNSENHSDTRTDDLSEARSGRNDSTTTDSGNNNRYGLNSSDPTGVTTDGRTTTVADTNSSTRNNTGTQTNIGTTSNTRNVTEGGTDKNEFNTNNNFDKEGYHKGNIGNISTQKLIGEELALWKWNFVQEALNDAKEFLTLPLYQLCNA